MKCQICGMVNPPGTRMCQACGFLMRAEVQTPGTKTGRLQPPAKRSLTKRQMFENSRAAAVLLAVIIVVVIIVAFVVFVKMHEDDAHLSATIYYRYDDGGGTDTPTVRVWGDVHNWGDGPGGCRLTLVISDDQGHSYTDTLNLGDVPAHEGVPVDKTYPWDFRYDPLAYPDAPVTVSYSL